MTKREAYLAEAGRVEAVARHYTIVQEDFGEVWKMLSPYFTPKEFACNETGLVPVHAEAFVMYGAVNHIRQQFGAPLLVTSAYRTLAYNKAVGGARYSQHPLGMACDLRPLERSRKKGLDQFRMDRLEKIARAGSARIITGTRYYGVEPVRGVGRYNSFIHLDWRKGGRTSWDSRT